MATIYHERTQELLTALSGISPLTAQAVQEAVMAAFPDAAKDAGPDGYLNDPEGEGAIVFARTVHAALPVPLNAMPFDWTKRHGFTIPQIFLSMPNLRPEDLAAWIERALAENAVVMAD